MTKRNGIKTSAPVKPRPVRAAPATSTHYTAAAIEVAKAAARPQVTVDSKVQQGAMDARAALLFDIAKRIDAVPTDRISAIMSLIQLYKSVDNGTVGIAAGVYMLSLIR